MSAQSRSAKTIALALVALIAAVFVPAFPNAAVREDPSTLPDPRIEAHISSADLAQILLLVRGGRFSSAYQRYLVQTHLPLRSISAATPSLLVGPGQPAARVAPPGEIQATFVTGCRPDCQEGMTYYFAKRGNSWHITKIERWVV
jgi:hypothetical protein